MHAARPRIVAWLLAGAAAVLACACPAAAQPVRIHDDWGRDVSLPAVPARVVSLAPHATELLFAAGVGGRVVAVDRDSDYPPQARSLPRVAAYPQPDVEQLLALVPDLVVIWGPGASRTLVGRLDALGLRVFVSEPRTLDDVGATIERFAQLADHRADDRAAALRAARSFRERLAAIRARYAGSRPVRAFVQIWSSPLIGIGDRDVIGDAVRSCGARNVLADAAVTAPRIDPESVIAARPEIVLATDGTRSERLWRERGVLAPQGSARFAAFDATTMERPGPRVLDAVERLCAAIDTVRRATP
jgi:ABC-type Fe3+-hydroxamate transport system substrate-binding protein